jgi:hypothetical protein
MRLFSPFAHQFLRTGILGLLIILLAACGGAGGGANTTGTSNSTPAQGGSKSTPTGPVGTITEFALPPSVTIFHAC